MSSSMLARLGKEVIGYTLSPSTSKSQSPSHAAIVSLNQINASSPVAHLRGTTPTPSSSSFTLASRADNVLLLHSDTSRPLIHVHEYQSEAKSSNCPLLARLHPPEVTGTLALSPSGTLLAAGSVSGRIYIWYLPSGNLIASLDAHFRPVTCLEWTSCETGLVSASEDARVLVWSVAALVDEANDNPTPYAIFADHVQSVTSIRLSNSSGSCISAFPSSTRLLSSSLDGTVKLWDIRSRSLIATWALPGPVKNLAVDVGFRSFFVSLRSRPEIGVNESIDTSTSKDSDTASQEESDEIRRIDLYDSHAHNSSSTASSSTHLQVTGQTVWRCSGSSISLTSMAMSLTGSHLLVGTSEASLQVFDVASSLLIRSASLVPAGNPSTNLVVSGLETFLVEDSSSALTGSMHKTVNRGDRWDVCEKLRRVKDEEPVFAMRLSQGRAAEVAKLLTPPSLQRSDVRIATAGGGGRDATVASSQSQLQEAQRQIAKLEAENGKLNDLLRRSQKANTGLWERVVKETMDAN